ncbi:hypothetical protein PI95_008250 [Hassallia byssoidea VB512170]|uniref:Uncharacterized protein n=1 Tax=Hassallia byssoidea VB512170 TaxID=1304833 RepID=A0A846H7F6_9CYAN|nr:hypothetical protein [Hassalia byssoidea]NEU72560.1 hypothetical protein [Hassalia byssoidea VB512170]
MNNKLVGSLFAGLTNGVVRGVAQVAVGAFVTGVLNAVGIETEDNNLTSDSQNDSDSNSDSFDNNTEA